MLTSYSESYKTWIFARDSLAKDVPVGRLLDFVINPDSGIFEGVWVQSTEGIRILSFKDILNWNDEGVFITQESEILEPKELPRIAKILEKEVPILNAKVFTEKSKKLLGKVADFAFDTISPRILSIKVRSGIWFFGKERLIGRSRIKKITEKGIFVREPGIRVTDEKKIETPVEKKLKSSVDSVRQRVEK